MEQSANNAGVSKIHFAPSPKSHRDLNKKMLTVQKVLDQEVRDVNMKSITTNTSCKKFRYHEVLLMNTGAQAL
jgi:hypothetical protein